MFFYSSVLWLIGLADIMATAYGISYNSDLFSEWNPWFGLFFERWGLAGLVLSKMTHHTLLIVIICVGTRFGIARDKITLLRAKAYLKCAIVAYLVIVVPAFTALMYLR